MFLNGGKTSYAIETLHGYNIKHKIMQRTSLLEGEKNALFSNRTIILIA